MREYRFGQELPYRPTPLVGRVRDIETATALLRNQTRLLTLTGPGGVGKTRLALEVAERLGSAFEDGVMFVSLVPITDPALVVTTVATALGVPEAIGTTREQSLKVALAGGEVLLVLDNFEQVIEAAPVMAALLAAAPRLRASLPAGQHCVFAASASFPRSHCPFPLPPSTRRASWRTPQLPCLLSGRGRWFPRSPLPLPSQR